VRARRHHDRRTRLAAPWLARAQHRHHTCSNERRLAGTGRADDRHEAVHVETGDEVGDERRTSEEERVVGGLERDEPLVGRHRGRVVVGVRGLVRVDDLGQVQGGILRGDRLLERLQLRPRLDAELVAEQRPRPLVGA
jgi:hypothetical protein